MSDDFGLGDVIVSLLWLMVLVAWIYLLIALLQNLFSDYELSGGAKAWWTLVLIALPWAGALLYLAARGSSMNERTRREVERAESDARADVPAASSGPGSIAAELARLVELRDSGAISADDYQAAKAKVLS